MSKFTSRLSKTSSRPRTTGGGGRRAGLERLEERALMASTPFGSVDLFDRDQIAGWAMNADDGPGATNIEITINGTKTTVSANTSRSDLAGPLGSPYHAFFYDMPTLKPGISNILVEAVSTSTGTRATLKAATLTNPAPVGNVDVFTDGRIAGWVADPDTTNSIKFRVDVDGSQMTKTLTTVSRPDIVPLYGVATAGFDISGSFAGKVIEVYAIDSDSGNAVLIFTNNKTPVGSLDFTDGVTVAGWALDPDNKSVSTKIRVDVDGIPLDNMPVSASLTRGDLVAVHGSANHGFSVSIPGLTPGEHTISVYAIDKQAASAAPVLLGSKVVTNMAPVGNIELVNGTQVAGWALDPDMGSNPSTINVYVDDNLFATRSANLNRPDLVATYFTPNHGFIVDLSALPAGSHSITVTCMDNRTSDENEVVIFDDFINNTVPTGNFDLVSDNYIYGWAFDADAPGTGIDVDIYVDGVYAATTTANVARGDVDSFLNSPNHAFKAELPTLSFGSHKIDVYASESQGNVSVLIGSKTVTNSRPIGSIDLVNNTTVAGWARDTDLIDRSLQIKVYVNNVLLSFGTANIDRPDVVSPGFNTYGFNLSLSLTSGRNQIDVYLVDKNNNMLSPLGSKVITI